MDEAVGERYPDLALAGEVTSNQPSYKKGLGGDGVTGWDWVIKAFQLARQCLLYTLHVDVPEKGKTFVQTKKMTILK